MAGDLEDFLRRAAQRRQAKGAQNQPGQANAPTARPAAKKRPEYSNRKTERAVAARNADEILVAEIVEDDDKESIAARSKRLEKARQAAKSKSQSAAPSRDTTSISPSPQPSRTVVLSGNPTHDLLQWLRQPGGIQQAILLREILDRPVHRW